MIPTVLAIAGTDPSGGAGIPADIKTISANRAYALTVITSVVAQTTTGVTAVHEIPASFVTTQIDTLCADVHVDATKIGLLPNPETVAAVAAALDRWQLPLVVLDPVLTAQSGHTLADPRSLDALRHELLPRAELITPNLPEAAALLREPPATDVPTMRDQATRLLHLGPRWVLLKGGHLPGPVCVDVLTSQHSQPHELPAPRLDTTNNHGTGCTLSSAIAALRPQRPTWPTAVTDAKHYLTATLAAADLLDIGHGPGPLHHFSDL